MIIKTWNGSSYVEQYAKTKTSFLYANDGTTSVFDANQKIKMQFMPDEVFDNLKFHVADGSNKLLRDILGEMLQEAGSQGRTPKGFYNVAGANITLTGNNTSTQIGVTGIYAITGLNINGSVVYTATAVQTGDWYVLEHLHGTGTVGDPYYAFFGIINNTQEAASTTVAGLVKLASDTSQSVAMNSITSTASRTYGIQNDGNGRMVVNVPWVDTNTTYSKATSTVLGLVELFDNTVQSVAANAVTTTANRTYGIQLNSSDQAVVNVPWTDTTYGLATASSDGLVRLGVAPAAATLETATTTAGRFYRVGSHTDGTLYVNVPWSDTNTTYAAATSSTLGLVRLTTDTQLTQTPQGATTTANRTYQIQKNASDQLVVNVPWTDSDTTYSMMTSSSLGLGRLWSDTVQSEVAQTVSSTASRTYGIQKNSNNQLVVNVPWTDNNTTYTAGSNGGLTLDSTAFRMTYPLFVQTATPTTTVTGAIWFDIN